jgi:hypothetical protein
MAACSYIHLGKANKDAKPPAEQTVAGKGTEATGAGEAGNEARERKWTNYASDRNGVTYYYEKESISHPSKGFVRAWRRRVFPERALQKEIIEFDEIDCTETTYRSLQLTALYRDGSAKSFSRVSPWTYIFPNSPDEVLLLDACMPTADKP